MLTDGPEAFGAIAPASIVAGGQSGVNYHFTIARDQVRLIRDSQLPFIFADIDPAIPHLYRLELQGSDSYRFSIDGIEIDAGVPEGAYPTDDSFLVFGATAAIEASTTRWDYIRFGAIPIDGSGDFDSDEDVDGSDFYFFHECMTNDRPGINGGPDLDAGPGCRFADFDTDNDVDLLDFAEFQLTFTGGE